MSPNTFTETTSKMLNSPIFSFFSHSPPSSPTQATAAPPAAPKKSNKRGHTRSSSVTLFTHQDGKNFEVVLVLHDDDSSAAPAAAPIPDLAGPSSEGTASTHPPNNTREEDWDSDDWDEDAEDLEEPTLSRLSPGEAGLERDRGMAKWEQRRRVEEWDGEDTQDLEEPPVAAWTERLERPESVRQHRGADGWRTRLAED